MGAHDRQSVEASGRVKLRFPHFHWWHYDGYDCLRGGIYFCRCGEMQYGARQ
jgi:hypothetical protein